MEQSSQLEHFQIVFVFDENYAKHFAVSLVSLFSVTTDPSKFSLWIFAAECTPISLQRVRALLRRYGLRYRLEPLDLNPVRSLSTRRHISGTAYAKLLVPDLLPDDIKRVVMVDPDTVFVSDPSCLFRLPLQRRVVGAVEEIGFEGQRELELQPDHPTFNSGVMLIDLQRYREDNVGPKLLAFVKERGRSTYHHDQAAFNAVLADSWLPLHPKWNANGKVYKNAFVNRGITITRSEILEARSDPAIVHFTGRNKPWTARCSHPEQKRYHYAAIRTPWRLSAVFGLIRFYVIRVGKMLLSLRVGVGVSRSGPRMRD